MTELVADLLEGQLWDLPAEASTTETGNEAPQQAVDLPGSLLADWEVPKDAMLNWIWPGMLEIRRLLFDSEDAPFRDRPEAVDWIESQASGREALSRGAENKWNRVWQELQDLVREMEHVTGVSRTLTLLDEELEFLRPDQQMPSVVGFGQESPLRPLALFSRNAARESLFSPAGIVNLVLTGKTPDLLRVESVVKHPPPPSRTQITINAQNISKEGFVLAWRIVKKQLGKKARLIDRLDQNIWNVVYDLGGPPEPEGDRKFWEGVRKELSSRDLAEYEDWRGPYMRWRRLGEAHPWLFRVVRDWGFSGLPMPGG